MQSQVIESHFNTLGLKAKDKVTGFEGIVTSLSFDLYGCIQYLITPEANGSTLDGACWFDVTRIEALNGDRVMRLPRWDVGYIASGKKGPAEKPAC